VGAASCRDINVLRDILKKAISRLEAAPHNLITPIDRAIGWTRFAGYGMIGHQKNTPGRAGFLLNVLG